MLVIKLIKVKLNILLEDSPGTRQVPEPHFRKPVLVGFKCLLFSQPSIHTSVITVKQTLT